LPEESVVESGSCVVSIDENSKNSPQQYGFHNQLLTTPRAWATVSA
jgi:hypothetical protein